MATNPLKYVKTTTVKNTAKYTAPKNTAQYTAPKLTAPYTAPKNTAKYVAATYNAPTYNDRYGAQVDAALNNVTNFSYDPMKDASYQALAQVYGKKG